MGLDIVVYKPIKKSETDVKDTDNESYVVLDNTTPELQIFSDFAVTCPIEYYDWETEFEKIGLNDADLEWTSSQSDEWHGSKHTFLPKNHELYKLHKKIDTTGGEFSLPRELFTRDELSLLDKYKINYGGDVGLYAVMSAIESFIEIVILNPVLKVVEENCIFVEEVGYQRKGANSLFYEEGMWEGPYVVDRTVLEKHWMRYFAEDENRKNDFYENIVEKFIEGETYVSYC